MRIKCFTKKITAFVKIVMSTYEDERDFSPSELNVLSSSSDGTATEVSTPSSEDSYSDVSEEFVYEEDDKGRKTVVIKD